VDVGARRHAGEEVFAERDRKGVSHGVDEYIGREEGERIVRDNERAERLSEERKVRPCGAENVVARGEVNEDDIRGVEVNREAFLRGQRADGETGNVRTSTRLSMSALSAS
jgi:hypothetical protein